MGQSSGRSRLGHVVLIMLIEMQLTLQKTTKKRDAPIETWMVIPIQVPVTFSWLSTTPVGQSSGRSRWGHQVVIMIMELPPTHPETSMCQETHMEDWIIIPMQATIQVGQSSEIGH